MDEDIVESDVELDNTDVVEPDNEPPQKVGGWKQLMARKLTGLYIASILNKYSRVVLLQMGDPSIEVTEQNMDAAQISKSKAVDAISEGMSLVLLG